MHSTVSVRLLEFFFPSYLVSSNPPHKYQIVFYASTLASQNSREQTPERLVWLKDSQGDRGEIVGNMAHEHMSGSSLLL